MAPWPAIIRNGNSNSGRQARSTSNYNGHNDNNSRAHASPQSPANVFNNNCHCSDHPVEVVGRIRDFPDRDRRAGQQSALVVVEGSNGREGVRIKTETGYRDFSLDGISLAQKEDLQGFYKRYVEHRVYGIKTGGRCTIIMYGPTGSGKSHTMFGCATEPGIVYRALHHILAGSHPPQPQPQPQPNQDGLFHPKPKVKLTVLEIYNEDIFDMLATGVPAIAPCRNSGCRVKLEVIGKKVKNAMSILGNEAGQIAKEVAKVERRRAVKNTSCNERSSRSHCVMILDVPAVGGRLVLVDMAGSENIEQAGSVGPEAKLQTGKINQGNSALKRVVEAIANGDSHVPFRDSKLTMLLQDSFEDDAAKILMVLCASPDARDIYKTMGTLEYGAKAKCIVRLPRNPPIVNNNSASLESVMARARIVAMDDCISKLQMDNKLKEQETAEALRELLQKEEEAVHLKAQIGEMEGKKRKAKDEIDLKVEERARLLRADLEKRCEENQRKLNASMEAWRLRMEKQILQQREEAELLRRRLEGIESELDHLRSWRGTNNQQARTDNIGKEIKVISETCLVRVDEQVANSSKILQKLQPCDTSMPSQEELQRITNCHGFECDNHGEISNGVKTSGNSSKIETLDGRNTCHGLSGDELNTVESASLGRKINIPTVFEDQTSVDEQKEGISNHGMASNVRDLVVRSGHADNSYSGCHFDNKLDKLQELQRYYETDARRACIETIFWLCGNHREVAAQARIAAGDDQSKEVSKVLEPISDESPTAAGKGGFMTPPGLSSGSGSPLFQNITRRASLESLPSGTVSSFLSPNDFACLKGLQSSNTSKANNLDTSTADQKVAQAKVKEMLQTTILINGISSASALTEVSSPLASCYEEFSRPSQGSYADGQNEWTEKKEDEIQEQRDEMCDACEVGGFH